MPGPVAQILTGIALEWMERRRDRRRTAQQEPDAPLTAAERADLDAYVAARAEQSPELQNATNQEPLVESRTFMGGVLAFITAAAAAYGALRNPAGINWEVAGPLIGTALAAFVVVVGRAKEGLVSIDWKRPWSIFGFGRAARGE